ncbi:MAG: hypothetical protein JHD40_01775, partial [Acidimicrobiia bacterium]|nr:hypothetical protein [Acidimicrobiia bacterium]
MNPGNYSSSITVTSPGGARRVPVLRRCIAIVSALTLLAAGLVLAAVKAAPASADVITVPVIGPPVLNAAQLAAWYRSTGRTLNVPGENIDALASYFVDEGVSEN